MSDNLFPDFISDNEHKFLLREGFSINEKYYSITSDDLQIIVDEYYISLLNGDKCVCSMYYDEFSFTFSYNTILDSYRKILKLRSAKQNKEFIIIHPEKGSFKGRRKEIIRFLKGLYPNLTKSYIDLVNSILYRKSSFNDWSLKQKIDHQKVENDLSYTFFHPEYGELKGSPNEIILEAGISAYNFNRVVNGKISHFKGWSMSKDVIDKLTVSKTGKYYYK